MKVLESVLKKMVKCQLITCSFTSCLAMEPPSKEEKAVLCFCGFRKGI